MNFGKKLLVSLALLASVSSGMNAMVPVSDELLDAEYAVEEAIAGNGNFIQCFNNYMELLPTHAQQADVAEQLLFEAIGAGNVVAARYLLECARVDVNVILNIHSLGDMTLLMKAISFAGNANRETRATQSAMIGLLLEYGAEFAEDEFRQLKTYHGDPRIHKYSNSLWYLIVTYKHPASRSHNDTDTTDIG